MKKKNILKIAIGLSISATSITTLCGADLNATSTQPKVTFIDSNHINGANTAVWEIKQTEASGFDYFYLRNILDDAKIITIDRLQDGSSTQGGSIQVISSGDLSLAGGAIYIGRDSKTLNVGKTTNGDATLNIYGDTSIGADIALDNNTSRWRLSNINDWFTIGPSLKNRWVFTISPNTPLYSFNIVDGGLVGIGTSTPSARLEVEGNAIVNGEFNTTKTITASFDGSTDDSAMKMINISVNNTNTNKKSDAGFAMTNARENFTWTFRTWEPDSGFAIAKQGNGGTKEFRLHDTDPADATTVVLELANGAYCDGVWHNTSSRSMKKDIQPLGTKEALEAFNKLQPVTYAYKANPTDQKVGFIAEDVPELVADPKHRSLSAMDMVALLTKVVQVQEKKMKIKDALIDEMKLAQKKQEEKLAKIEALLTNLALVNSNKKKDPLSLNFK